MKPKETEFILFEGLLHSENSRPEFYISIAKQKGYSLKTFFEELLTAYQRIENFVNSYENTTDIYLDEAGNEFKQKNIINLYQYSNGKYSGQIDSNNVQELLIGLIPLSKKVFGKQAKEVINNLYL
jgi:uncharacterized protein YqfB (UPF0267 family)